MFVLPLIFACSCTNELEVNEPVPTNKPIIYFLLNPGDSVQVMRLQSAFLGIGDALETAQNPDSIYPYGSNVVLQQIEEGQVVASYPLEAVPDQQKDPGIFAESGHLLYKFNRKIVAGTTYRMQVNLPDGRPVIEAEATPYNHLEVTEVNRWPNGINMVNAKFARVKWLSLPETETYQLTITFNYYDITTTDTIQRSVAWKLPRVTSSSTLGGEELDMVIPIEKWYLFLSDHIPVNEDIVKRVAGRFDYRWDFAGTALESYLMQEQTMENGLLSDYTQFSNIPGAIGIFTYRSYHQVKGYSISLYTLERLTTHPSTKDMRFDGRQYW
jgi:hypothetical protein